MADAQRRAVENHRRRLRERGLGRFEVRGLEADKALLRTLAGRLAEGNAESGELRAAIAAKMAPAAAKSGGILEALRRSPLVGADLAVDREAGAGRDIDL